MTEELLPCPFCNGEAYNEESSDEPPWWRIGCDACNFYMVTRDGDFDSLVRKWNTRPQIIPKWLKDAINDEVKTLDVKIKNAKTSNDACSAHYISRYEEQQLIYLQILDLEES